MRRARQRGGFPGRRKHALQQDALGVGGPEARMDPAVNLVERRDHFPAQGQEFLVRG